MQVSRRQFFKICAGGMAGTTAAALGFAPSVALAETRQYKLLRTRGALCPKGAGLVDFIHSESRLKFPEYRAPGSDKWQQISWEEAFDRIAKLMKEDRDANYIAQNAEGVTVNRWLSTGMLCASASSNETGYLTQKFSRALGMLAVDNQARV